MGFRSARENAGYTQREIANMLGLDETTPVKWETGKTKPRAETLAKLASIYCCTIEQLLEPDIKCPPDKVE